MELYEIIGLLSDIKTYKSEHLTPPEYEALCAAIKRLGEELVPA